MLRFSNPYAMAIDVQDASNLSGVAKDLSILVDLARRDLLRRGGLGADGSHELATHPAVQLYLSKLAEMAELGLTDGDTYGKAYQLCRERRHEAASQYEY